MLRLAASSLRIEERELEAFSLGSISYPPVQPVALSCCVRRAAIGATMERKRAELVCVASTLRWRMSSPSSRTSAAFDFPRSFVASPSFLISTSTATAPAIVRCACVDHDVISPIFEDRADDRAFATCPAGQKFGQRWKPSNEKSSRGDRT